MKGGRVTLSTPTNSFIDCNSAYVQSQADLDPWVTQLRIPSESGASNATIDTEITFARLDSDIVVDQTFATSQPGSEDCTFDGLVAIAHRMERWWGPAEKPANGRAISPNAWSPSLHQGHGSRAKTVRRAAPQAKAPKEKRVSTRPRHLTRSPTGCWTCRIRHKRCPEDGFPCTACERLGLECDSSSLRPPYMSDADTRAAMRLAIRLQTDKVRCQRHQSRVSKKTDRAPALPWLQH